MLAVAVVTALADPDPIVFDYAADEDHARTAAVDGQGHLYVLGSCVGEDDDYDVVLVQFDESSGSETGRWVYCTFDEEEEPLDDIAVDLALDPEGSAAYVLATGGADPDEPGTWEGFHTVKFDLNQPGGPEDPGEPVWHSEYVVGIGNLPVGLAVCRTANDQVFVAVTGISLAFDDPEQYGRDIHTICYSEWGGEPCWEAWLDGGGGSLATESLQSRVVAVKPEGMSCDELARRMRLHRPPVFGRVENDEYLLDFRTLDKTDIPVVAQALLAVLGE